MLRIGRSETTVRLVSAQLRASEFSVALDKLPVIVGRSAQADVRLDDQWVSRVHCKISELNGTLIVRDLDSRNGTLVNGEYIQEAHLSPGDRLTVGTTSFEACYKPGKANRQLVSSLKCPSAAQSVYPK